jgi:hypothetical protein
VNAAILMTGFGMLARDRVENRIEAAALVVGMGMAGEALWELMEFLGYKLGYRGMGLTYEDTMADTIESLAGSALAAAIVVTRWDQRLRERLQPTRRSAASTRRRVDQSSPRDTADPALEAADGSRKRLAS